MQGIPHLSLPNVVHRHVPNVQVPVQAPSRPLVSRLNLATFPDRVVYVERQELSDTEYRDMEKGSPGFRIRPPHEVAC